MDLNLNLQIVSKLENDYLLTTIVEKLQSFCLTCCWCLLNVLFYVSFLQNKVYLKSHALQKEDRNIHTRSHPHCIQIQHFI